MYDDDWKGWQRMNLLNGVISVFLALFYIKVMRKCMDAFFLNYKKSILGVILWGGYFIFQVYLEIIGNLPPAVTLITNVVLVFLVSLVSYRGNLRRHIVFSMLICTIWMLIEIILNVIFSLIRVSVSTKVAGAIISKMLMLVVSIILGRCLKKTGEDIPKRYVAIMMVSPLGSIYIIHNVFVMSEQTGRGLVFAFLTGFLLLIINYIIFEVYEWLAQKAEYQSKSILYEQQLELCTQQVIEREAFNNELRRVRHDMKNHLTSILGMVEFDEKQKAKDYIMNLLADGIEYIPEHVSRSGNIVIDSLINHKCAIAKKLGIDFQANIFVPVELPFRGGHLTIIFGNLIENAIDACKEVNEGKRFIEIDATFSKNILTLMINNACAGKRSRDARGRYPTTKIDTKNHGLGLASVDKALEIYHGDIITESRDGSFNVRVVMYGLSLSRMKNGA